MLNTSLVFPHFHGAKNQPATRATDDSPRRRSPRERGFFRRSENSCSAFALLSLPENANEFERERVAGNVVLTPRTVQMATSISVIIPTLNEAENLPRALAALRCELPHAELVVVDAGSTDGTVAVAKNLGVTALTAATPGRGSQCREGAARASGEWLLFLHGDTFLCESTGQTIERFCSVRENEAANFRLRFDEAQWFLRLSGRFSAIDSVFTRFGDQGILVRSTVYHEVGGFPAWPLFEDVELLRRLRRRRRVPSLRPGVLTSARRFRQHGPVRQQLRNGRLLVRFLLGADPARLAADYRRGGPR